MAGHQESEEIKPRSPMVTSTGYWFSDHSNSNPNMVNHQLQNFVTNPEMYNLTSGMEMIGFPPKNFHHHDNTNNNPPPHVLWKGNFFNKISDGPSSSKNIITEQFYQHGNFTKGPVDFGTSSENMLITTTHDDDHQESWHENNRTLLVDDPSLRCVFPCEGNERPSQGLSLSLCSSNPSSIGLQSFELRHQQEIGIIHDGFLGKSPNLQQQHHQQGYFHHQIRDSKYLGPAQELLSEFCSLGIKQNNDHSSSKVLKQQQQKPHQWQDHESASTSKKQLLQSLDLLELQKRKTKLLQMLEEATKGFPTDEYDGNSSMETATRSPERSVSVLRAWLFEHFLHPYPSDVDKHILARQTGLSRSQVSNWFINARVRLWKPMVEEMYLEETKEEENLGSPDGSKALDDMNGTNQNNPQSHIDQDQKPSLVRIDSECISSIINHPHEKNDTNKNCLQRDDQVQNYGVRGGDQSFGAIELDFSAYGGDHGGISNKNLGLGGDTSSKFTFYPRDDQVQYSSLLDSENQNLPYRNLMGAQLLHDLAG
ncbi:unnamed protein product [Withania somnifera]